MNMSQFFLVMFCYDNIIIRCKIMIDLDVFIVNLSVTRPQAVVLMWLGSYWTGSAMHIYGVQCLKFLGNHWSASCHQSISRTKSWRFVLFYSTIKLKYMFLYFWCTVSTCKYQYPSWNDWVCIYVTNIHIKYYWYVYCISVTRFYHQLLTCWENFLGRI